MVPTAMWLGCRHTLGHRLASCPALSTANACFPSARTPGHQSERDAASNTKGVSIREMEALVNEETRNRAIMSYCIITECKSHCPCYLQFSHGTGRPHYVRAITLFNGLLSKGLSPRPDPFGSFCFAWKLEPAINIEALCIYETELWLVALRMNQFVGM